VYDYIYSAEALLCEVEKCGNGTLVRHVRTYRQGARPPTFERSHEGVGFGLPLGVVDDELVEAFAADALRGLMASGAGKAGGGANDKETDHEQKGGGAPSG